MQSSKLKPKTKNYLKKFFYLFSQNKLEYLILSSILIFSAFFRLFRLNLLLGFWYDQGRDALIIWDLIHYGRFFLIGPVTGIEGIFLGPFYYYLLAPFYLIGGGNPVFAAAGLSLLTVGSIFLIFLLAKEIYNVKVALLAAFLYGFSYYLVTFSRWLANPNPLPFFTLLTLLFLYKFIQTHNSLFIILSSFVVGLCLQLEAASAVFFLPAMAVILIWQGKNIKNPKILLLAFLAFLITLLPQILFDIKHQGILRSAFNKFLVEEKSFNFSFVETFQLRLLTYYDVFLSKLLPEGGIGKLIVLALFSAALFIFRKKVFLPGGKMLIIWLAVPLVGFFFYQGNHGYVWDYYFTGVIPSFIILFAAVLVFFWERWLIGKGIVILFLIIFLTSNMRLLKNYFVSGIGIVLRSQLRAIDWVYNDVKNEQFNVDVYVPPKIFYSYSYLFKWYGQSKYGREPETKQVKNLYTLSEPDGSHPQFLQAWLKRQEAIGKPIDNYFWGDITVQKRERIKYE